jgi:rod shape determining protein RodA
MPVLKKNRFRFFGIFFLLLFFLLCLMGGVTLYSATQGGQGYRIPLHHKQAAWCGLGMAGLIFLAWISHRQLEHYAYGIYGVSLLLLIIVLVFGRSIAGARRWLELGPLQFQPSELMKLTLVMALAKYFHQHPQEGGYNLLQIKVPFLIFLVPFLLVLLQPDLGTSIILLLLFGCILLFVGLTRRSLLILVLLGIASVPAGWHSLKDYQKERILNFLDSSRDPLGTGYHMIQSKIAIGSGGVWGKGFLKSTQARLHFLPEQQTDFIFSVFVEEWGFAGSLLLLAGYLLLILWALNIASQAKDRFGMLMSLGVALFLFWHVFINMGMCLGLLPVVGIPLPLFSYGGSFLFAVFLGMGLLLNVYVNRFMFQPTNYR